MKKKERRRKVASFLTFTYAFTKVKMIKKLEIGNYFVVGIKNFSSIKNEWDRILKNRLKTVEGFFLFRFGKRRKDKVRLLLY